MKNILNLVIIVLLGSMAAKQPALAQTSVMNWDFETVRDRSVIYTK